MTEDPGSFNQGMMEFGATQFVPLLLIVNVLPLSNLTVTAFAKDLKQKDLPVKSEKAKST